MVNSLSKRELRYLRNHCPSFLDSYKKLLAFYKSATECYTMKVWKDGRVVLTPIKDLRKDEITL